MILEGKITKGIGNASFWVKKIENIFLEEEKIKLFPGTLNVHLEKPYELKDFWILKKEEYGGMQNVFVQKCQVLGHRAYIVRAEKTIHSKNIIEIVSDVNFRKTYNLKDNDIVKILVLD